MSIAMRKLADISSMQTGKLNSNAAVPNGIFPFFTCAQETYRINKAAFNTEAVLLGGNNANGVFPLKYYNGEFNAYQRTYVIETLDRNVLDTRYLFYALQPALSKFQAASIGAATQYLTKSILDNFKIGVPDLDVQKRIVNLLSSYDDLIENNRRRIQLLEQAARLLYKEWFVHLRFPGHEHVKIKDGVPEGWQKKSALDIMDVMSGGTPKVSVPNYWGGEIPFFTSKDTTDYAYVFRTERTLTEEGLNNCNSRLYPKDTVFITARGTVGKINLAQTDMAMNQSCYALVANPPLNQQFLYFALAENIEQFRSRAVGTIFDAIIRDTFKLIPFLVPDIRLIKRFTRAISPTLRQIDVLSTQIRKLVQARSIILPRLMNGEVIV